MSVAFLVTALVIVATPGTGALLTIAGGLRGGYRLALLTALGCTVGIIPHLAAAITGAAALLQASGVAFQVLKVLGIGYLLYMAWSTWRDTGQLRVEQDSDPRGARQGTGRVVLTAVLANLLNPKLKKQIMMAHPSTSGTAYTTLWTQVTLRGGEKPVPPLHWEIEFPEVFGRENPGFDAMVGNPPFAGKNTVVFATDYGE